MTEDRSPTLAECARFAWDLRVGCRACDRHETWTHRQLARRFRRSLGATLQDVIDRVKCSTCGGKCVFQMVQGASSFNGSGWGGPGHDGEATREAAFRELLAQIDAELAAKGSTPS